MSLILKRFLLIALILGFGAVARSDANPFPENNEGKKKDQPNILVIWGDDVGQSNISAYTRGMMGFRTPNIDRIANEGILFTDYYGEQSCTAGRSSFIMGQSVFRTGLSKVGLPGAKEGMNVADPTIAGLLKDLGYATGNSARTTSVTAMSTCQQTTGSMSSSETCIT